MASRSEPTRRSWRAECAQGLLFAAPAVALSLAAGWWSGWPRIAACAGLFAWTAALIVVGIGDERAFWRDVAEDDQPPADTP